MDDNTILYWPSDWIFGGHRQNPFISHKIFSANSIGQGQPVCSYNSDSYNSDSYNIDLITMPVFPSFNLLPMQIIHLIHLLEMFIRRYCELTGEKCIVIQAPVDLNKFKAILNVDVRKIAFTTFHIYLQVFDILRPIY